MLDSLLSTTAADTLTITGSLLVIGSAILLGLFISGVYLFTHKNEEYSGSFAVSLILLPAIIAMIILLVGNNVARAFSLAGAFSLIRFRSAPGDAKDISYVFFTLGVGLACGMGYLGYAALFAVILCLVMVILEKLRFGSRRPNGMQLKITLPEDMDYEGVFEDILKEYTATHRLIRIRTTEFGSLFELTYDVRLKSGNGSKAMVDKIRCKNGNLNIVLLQKEWKEAGAL